LRIFLEEWADDDKNLAKKLEKKQEEERKKAEALRKKAEAKALLEQEEAELKKACVAKIPLAKKSQYEIEKEVAQRNKNIENINNPPKAREPKVIPLEENINHLMADVEVASNIDQAISVLKVSESEDDRHPEKRMKAAFKAYEDTEIPILKAQNPSLKLSQLKQMVFKNWQKSPENPLNRN
jgi:chromosome segregation ATPase